MSELVYVVEYDGYCCVDEMDFFFNLEDAIEDATEQLMDMYSEKELCERINFSLDEDVTDIEELVRAALTKDKYIDDACWITTVIVRGKRG